MHARPGNPRQFSHAPFDIVSCTLAGRFGLWPDLDREVDEKVIFFPSLARPLDGGTWEVKIHGFVFEPEKRVVPLAMLKEMLAIDHVHLSKEETLLFKERARLFMEDEKGGKKIAVRIGERTFRVGKSQANGHFTGRLVLTEPEIQRIRQAGSGFELVLPSGDQRQFTGEVHFFEEGRTIVISDIDDTIKITGVGDSRTAMRNTFIRPFEAVPQMAELYRGWAETNHAQFIYVSASPWQLFTPLEEFISSNGFPAGLFFLKTVDVKDKTLLALFQGPEKYKPGVIEPLMKQFPHRKVVLVGDSGEKDPEIYAALARAYPEQVSHIFIRDLNDGKDHAERYRNAFEGLAPSLWKTFHEPSDILSLTP